MGMCSGCAGAQGTLKNFIEKVIQEKVSKDLTVEQA
jgi:Fe-S cluster biogenesis protein NfuA